MNSAEVSQPSSPIVLEGRVASLHLHPLDSKNALQTVQELELVAGGGIRGDARYFGRVSRSTGELTRRQVTLIEREQIAEHAATMRLKNIPPGAVRSNIETIGIELLSLLGRHVVIGGAILHFYEPRTPCAKMDALCQGLREAMKNNRQGVLAEIVQSGVIRVGDSIKQIILSK